MSAGNEPRAKSPAASAPRAAPAMHTAIVAGVCLGMLAATIALSPTGRWIERTLARDWIFNARGVRPPPSDVVVVSMNNLAMDLPAVTRDDRRWSRHLYATLVDQLSAAGASAVVLDVAFEDHSEKEADQALESALLRSDRVVLFQRLIRTDVGDAPVPPLPRFASAARVRAVFPLPKQPQRVDYYWPFFRAFVPVVKDGTGVNDGGRMAGEEYALTELPSLPVAALQLTVLHAVGPAKFERFLRELGHAVGSDGRSGFAAPGGIAMAMTELRRAVMDDRFSNESTRRAIRTTFGERAAVTPLLDALFDVFAEPGELHLNFYGPSRTIATLEHDKVIDTRGEPGEALRDAVADKVVFIGHSDPSAVDQKDGFHTVYTRLDGVDLSGVEIAATAFANLADGSVLRPAVPALVVLIHVLLGVASALIALRAGVLRAVVLIVALGVSYFALVVHATGETYLLLPLGMPLLALLPFTLFASLLYRHVRTRRQRDRYQHGARLMLPHRAVRDIESNRVENAVPERLHGACMISDVADYTHLSEILPPEHLASLSREYFTLLTERTTLAGGELIDLEGDSMTVVWIGAAPSNEYGHLAAHAAVEIMSAVEWFNEQHPNTPFATRIGLHAGEVTAGNIGGGRNFRHRVVGDIVNTSSRLEGLNKRLGTSVLATRAVVDDADLLLVRPVGTFVLKGKAEALEVFEIVDHHRPATPVERVLCERFAEALSLLKQGRLEASEQCLVDMLRTVGSDGPASFYVELMNGRGAPDVLLDDSGVVRVNGK